MLRPENQQTGFLLFWSAGSTLCHFKYKLLPRTLALIEDWLVEHWLVEAPTEPTRIKEADDDLREVQQVLDATRE